MRGLLLLSVLLVVPHAAAFDSGQMRPGDMFSHTFTEENPDGYHYHCHPHPWMTGMVHVNADTDGNTTTHFVDIVESEVVDDWGYSIEHLVIEVGDKVVWTNTGDVIHTVTLMEGDDHGDHGDHDGHGHGAHVENAPAPALGLLILGLAGLALRRRA